MQSGHLQNPKILLKKAPTQQKLHCSASTAPGTATPHSHLTPNKSLQPEMGWAPHFLYQQGKTHGKISNPFPNLVLSSQASPGDTIPLSPVASIHAVEEYSRSGQ